MPENNESPPSPRDGTAVRFPLDTEDLRFRNPDNGLYYRPVPRAGNHGDIVTEWVPA